MIDRLVTDLPEPDSPTTASVSPGSQRKRNVLDGFHQPGIGEEMRLQVADLQQWAIGAARIGHGHIAFRSLGSSRSRKPSPTICSDSAERMIATPGNTTSQIA